MLRLILLTFLIRQTLIYEYPFIKDAEMFYRMLTTVARRDEVDIRTFVAGCMGMRGTASSIDLHALSFELKIMHLTQRRFFSLVEERLMPYR